MAVSRIIVAALLALAGTSAAYAQAAAPATLTLAQKAHDRGGHWRSSDADGDGRISREEWLARPQEFIRRADGNSDGKVTAKEFADMVERRLAERLAAMFKRLDSNGDGFLRVEELAERSSERFDRMDANHDGFIGKDEMHRKDRHRRGPEDRPEHERKP